MKTAWLGLHNEHWTTENYRQRCTRKQAQYILLNHETIIFHGNIHWIKAKHVGAGIYEIYKVKMD